MEKLLVTPEEAAELLSIGRTRTYELIALGVLRSVQIGKSRRIPMASIHEFVEQLRDEGDVVALAYGVDVPARAR